MKKLALIVILAVLAFASSAQAANIEFVQPRDQRHPGASIHIEGGSECVPVFGKITFEDRMTTASVDLPWKTQTFYTQDICNAHWVEMNVPHLLVWTWSEKEEDEGVEPVGTSSQIGINLGSERTIPAYEYRVTVQIGEQEVGRLLTAYAFRDGYNQKIWWGTDAFINYCINKGKEVRSFYHRLFCVRHVPSTGLEQLRWHKLTPLR